MEPTKRYRVVCDHLESAEECIEQAKEYLHPVEQSIADAVEELHDASDEGGELEIHGVIGHLRAIHSSLVWNQESLTHARERAGDLIND